MEYKVLIFASLLLLMIPITATAQNQTTSGCTPNLSFCKVCIPQAAFCPFTDAQKPKMAVLYNQIQQIQAHTPLTLECRLQLVSLEMKIAAATHNNQPPNPFLDNPPSIAQAAPACSGG